MVKNCFIVSGLGTFLFVSMLSPAKPAPAKITPGTVLGSLEGTLNFCAKVDPPAAPIYKSLGQLIINRQSAKAIAEVRRSDAYEDAYQQISTKLQSLPANQAQATCNAH